MNEPAPQPSVGAGSIGSRVRTISAVLLQKSSELMTSPPARVNSAFRTNGLTVLHDIPHRAVDKAEH